MVAVDCAEAIDGVALDVFAAHGGSESMFGVGDEVFGTTLSSIIAHTTHFVAIVEQMPGYFKANAARGTLGKHSRVVAPSAPTAGHAILKSQIFVQKCTIIHANFAVNALVGLIDERLVEPVIIEPYVDDVLRATHGAHTASEAIFHL